VFLADGIDTLGVDVKFAVHGRQFDRDARALQRKAWPATASPAATGILVENLDRLAHTAARDELISPRYSTGLHDPAALEALVLDDAPAAMRLAVPSFVGSAAKSLPRRIQQSDEIDFPGRESAIAR
jgi:hypothetical protein